MHKLSESQASRRRFLKGAVLLAGGTVAIGLAGACSSAPPTQAPATLSTSASAAAAATAPAAAPTTAASSATMTGPVNWLSWSVYQLPELMKGFSDKTNIPVNPINFEDDSEGFLKVKNGGGGKNFDISMSDGFWPVQYFKDKLIEPMDVGQMTSAAGLHPKLRALAAWKQPDGRMLQFPASWSVEPIIYRKGKVTAFDTHEVLWDPKYKGRIIQMDRPSEYIAMVAIWLGFKEPFKLTDDQLAQVKNKLMEQRPLIKTFTAASSDFVKAMAAGEGDLGYGTSPAMVYRIKKAGATDDFGAVVPKAGTTGWVDGNMLVAGAAHHDAALAYINHFGSPESQAAFAVKAGYPISSEAGVKILESSGQTELVEQGGFKNWDAIDGMTMLDAPDNIEKWTQVWNEFKAG
jgi:putative spermidine/putrescine transport system substrate-binding protein/spermidine/putrescine transport system substrate-binding protein